MLGFYVPPTAKIIWRRDLGLNLIRKTDQVGEQAALEEVADQIAVLLACIK